MVAGTNQKLDRTRSQCFSNSAFKKPHFNPLALNEKPMLALNDRRSVDFRTAARCTLPHQATGNKKRVDLVSAVGLP